MRAGRPPACPIRREPVTKTFLRVLVLVVLFVCLTPARAVLIAFHDRASWEAVVSHISGTEDFETFTTDTPFRDIPVAINGNDCTGWNNRQWRELKLN